MQALTALILAGGIGTRLRQVVGEYPKVLAEVNGRPFITFLLQQLAHANLADVILCTGYKAESVQSTIGNHFAGVAIRYSAEETPLGTAGAIRNTLHLVVHWPLLVMNGDSFCEVDLKSFCDWHHQKGAIGSLVLTQVADTSRFGQVQVDADGQIQRFVEKGTQSTSGWINAGIYLLEQEMAASIPLDRPVSIEHDIFPRWVKQGLYGYCGGGQFLDIGTPESFATAAQFLEKVVRV